MPKHLTARPPVDVTEERKVRKLTRSTHAPADWIFHAKIVAHSWDGLPTAQIAEVLGCHPQTVRERLHAFNDRSFDGLGIKPGAVASPGSPTRSAVRFSIWSSSHPPESPPMNSRAN